MVRHYDIVEREEKEKFVNAMEILVIILSIFLAIFLLIGIVLAIMLVKVTQQIRRVTSTAEKAALSFEKVAANVSKVSSPLLIAKMLQSQLKKFTKK